MRNFPSPIDCMTDPTLLYTRELPGGGFVAIEAAADAAGYHAQISVERRGDPKRREGHTPPVIAEASGSTTSDVLQELYEIAADNVAVARGLIEWQARRR
jgi:hypothetical protein